MSMHAPKMARRVARAARVSTIDQDVHGTSLEDQLRKGDLAAELHDETVVDHGEYSGDESGCLPLSQRPIMQRLLADARAGRFDAVVFHRIDRMARRASYIFEIWEALEQAGVTIYIVDPAIDSSHPFGRLMRTILAAFAEFERDMIVERLHGGRLRRVAQGRQYLPAGKYGYAYTPIDRATETPGHIERAPTQAALVQRIYRRRARGVSFERIAAEVTAEGVPAPRGGPRWNYSTVKNIVQDRAYMGEGRYGVRQSVRNERGKCVLRPRRDGRTPLAMAFPPIVTPEEWYAANAPAGGPRACAVRAEAGKFLLGGGLVRCAEHDLAMSGETKHGRWTRYTCKRPVPGGGRTSHGVPGRALEEAVWADVVAFLLAPERGLAAARREAEDAEGDLEALAARRAALGARLGEIEREGRWLLTEGYKTGATPSMIGGRMAELNAEAEALRGEEVRLAAQVDLARDRLPQAAAMERLLTQYREGAAKRTPAERRAILDALDVHVLMRGQRYRLTGVVREMETEGDLGGADQQSVQMLCRRAALPFALEGTLERAG